MKWLDQCHPGLKCHFGADYEALGEWAKTSVCPGCISLLNCTNCVPHNPELQCRHPVCAHRRTQLLLQHPAVGCSPGFTEVWHTLHKQCAMRENKCCGEDECPVPTTRHCGLRFTNADQYAASLYIGVATVAGALALLRDDATTVRAISSNAKFAF